MASVRKVLLLSTAFAAALISLRVLRSAAAKRCGRSIGRTGARRCRLSAFEYTHVEDTSTGEVLTLMGPLSFPLKSHHRLLHEKPLPCVVIPPNHYVCVHNPVHRSGPEISSTDGRQRSGYPLWCLSSKQLRSPSHCTQRFGRREMRFARAPFPLFPGEVLEHEPREQPLLRNGEALHVRCLEDFTVRDATQATTRQRERGEEYCYKGPALYYPRVEEEVVGRLPPRALTREIALLCTAMQALVDETNEAAAGGGVRRAAHERFTVRGVGAYYQPPNTRLDAIATAIPLPAGVGVRVRATGDFKDHYTGEQRRAGQEWLVTRDSVGAAYVPCHLEETVDACVRHVVLGRRQYCVIHNPPSTVAGGAGAEGLWWGGRERRVGPCSFFLEDAHTVLEGGIRNAFTLTPDEALLVEATQPFTEAESGVERAVASRWLVRGPCSYTPPLEVRVLERRETVLLSHNSGVYVRHTRTGQIRCVYGKPFMLSEEEEMWEKPTSRYIRRLMEAPRLCIRVQEEPDILEDWEQSTRRDAETMLMASASLVSPQSNPDSVTAAQAKVRKEPHTPRHACDANGVKLQSGDTRRCAVVSVNVEQNTLVLLQNINDGTSRVVAGPATVHLGPYEEFASIVLSGGRPKQPDQIHTLSLFLGPDYMSDVIEVETLDHARLKLTLAYNWEFDSKDMDTTYRKVFTLPDFVGEACKTLASRLRVAIASSTFESFHRNSSSVIRQAIFSATADGSTELRGDSLYFLSNGLRITNVDLQSVEPVEPNTRAALTKSVQLAVEILTKSQENQASHHAARVEQEAKGALDLQVVKDKATAERERVSLMKVMVRNMSIEHGSASKVQALAESGARTAEAQAELDITPLRCAAHEVGVDAELDILGRRAEADLAHRQALNELQVAHTEQLAETEAHKYESIMSAVGRDTVVAIASAGPQLKARMLAALGLQGFLITDGSAPLNLMSVASQLAAVPSAGGVKPRGAGGAGRRGEELSGG